MSLKKKTSLYVSFHLFLALSFFVGLGLLAGCKKTAAGKAEGDETAAAPEVVVSTLAGNGNPGYADGPGNVAEFYFPFDITIDTAGNLYVADSSNNRIRKITPRGEVSTLAGSGRAASSALDGGYADGLGEAARFNVPGGITIDKEGNLYVSDSANHRIRKITPRGEVSTFAGDGKRDFADGPGEAARFNVPGDITIDKEGNLYVVDTFNHRIRKISPEGEVSTFAGGSAQTDEEGGGETNKYLGGFSDGQGSAAQFRRPHGIVIDASANLYVADTFNNRIRKITPRGEVSTFAGSGRAALPALDGGYADGPGNVAEFYLPSDITIDTAGNLYVADTLNNRIRKITPKGEVSTLAGSGRAASAVDGGGYADGPGNVAEFYLPSGITIDTAGNLYVADSSNHRIRKIVVK